MLGILDIADLVGELDELCARRKSRRVLDFESLSLQPRERAIVRDFEYERGDRRAEMLLDLLGRRLGILDGVVQDGCDQNLDIIDASDTHDAFGDFQRMIDVRRFAHAFPPLVAMAIRREDRRREQARRRGRTRRSGLCVVRAHFGASLDRSGSGRAVSALPARTCSSACATSSTIASEPFGPAT